MTQKGEQNSYERDKLFIIALRQKVIITCALIYALCVGLYAMMPPGVPPYLAIVGLGAVLVGAVFVFLLAMRLYGLAWGVFLGMLTLIPLVGLIVLLIVNSKASSTLEDNGVSVGLMGADLSEI